MNPLTLNADQVDSGDLQSRLQRLGFRVYLLCLLSLEVKHSCRRRRRALGAQWSGFVIRWFPIRPHGTLSLL